MCELVGSGYAVCVPLFDHCSSACMCSAKFEYSLCVCDYVKANIYVILCDYDAMLEEGNG